MEARSRFSTTGSGGGNAFIEQAAGGLALTSQSTIQGSGIIGQDGLSLSNSGTIDANSAGGPLLTTLTLQGLGAVTNTGLMEATGSGVLQINGATVDNASGNIAANGGTVQLFGNTSIQGGTLNTLSGGVLGTPANNAATLDGSSNGALTLSAGSTYTSDLNSQTTLLGTINNSGNLQFNGGSGTNSFLLMGNNVTLQGGGMVTLNTAGGGGNAFIDQAAADGLTLTNVNNTIQGAGIIGNNGLSLVNDVGGTLLANVPGQTLSITGVATLTNNGTMQVNNGSTLTVSSGSGFTTNTGNVNVDNGGTFALQSTNFNQTGGNTRVDGAFGGSGVQVNISGGALLGNGSTPFGTDGTITGNVNIGGSGTISPGDAPGTAGQLSILGNYSQSGSGTFIDEIGGLTPGTQFDQLNISGTALLGGTLDVDLLNGFTPAPGNDFFILIAALGVSGQFSTVDFADAPLPNGEAWNVVYNPNNVELEVTGTGPPPVPEPSTVLLLATGIAMVAALLRYRKTVWTRR